MRDRQDRPVHQGNPAARGPGREFRHLRQRRSGRDAELGGRRRIRGFCRDRSARDRSGMRHEQHLVSPVGRRGMAGVRGQSLDDERSADGGRVHQHMGLHHSARPGIGQRVRGRHQRDRRLLPRVRPRVRSSGSLRRERRLWDRPLGAHGLGELEHPGESRALRRVVQVAARVDRSDRGGTGFSVLCDPQLRSDRGGLQARHHGGEVQPDEPQPDRGVVVDALHADLDRGDGPELDGRRGLWKRLGRGGRPRVLL